MTLTLCWWCHTLKPDSHFSTASGKCWQQLYEQAEARHGWIRLDADQPAPEIIADNLALTFGEEEMIDRNAEPLWRIDFDEPRFAAEDEHHFSFGTARKVDSQTIIDEMVKRAAKTLRADQSWMRETAESWILDTEKVARAVLEAALKEE